MRNYDAFAGPLSGMKIWRVTSDGSEHRVIPDAAMDFVLTGDSLLFAGPDTAASIVRSDAGTVTWGLQLPPGLAQGILKRPAAELRNQRVKLDELVPSLALDAEQMNADPVSSLEALTVGLVREADPDRSLLRLARSLDHAARTGGRVRDIADQHGLSLRTLHRLSVSFFGYGTKTLIEIHRLQNALRLARSGASTADAATAANYSDQAHLSRETQRLADSTFRALLQP